MFPITHHIVTINTELTKMLMLVVETIRKLKKQDADYFYNGHWDENYIDRYQREEE